MRANMRSKICPHPGEQAKPGTARPWMLWVLVMLALIALAGCDQLSAVSQKAEVPVATSVAETVQAALQPAGVPIGTSIAATVAAAIPTAVPPTVAPPTLAPTYTPYPTFTPLPTYTEQPTYTPIPTYTPLPPPPQQPIYNPPIIYIEPSPVPPYRDHPFVLRVWNRNQKQVLWIGTEMPYGGNFIKPNYYVEFYPPYATWMHIVYCRREVDVKFPGWWNNHWYNSWNEDWLDNYNKSYICSAKDVFVDQPFQELSVK